MIQNNETIPADIKITKEVVREANPEFFAPSMMEFVGTTEEEWDVGEFKNQPCIFVKRPAAQATAVYIVNPISFKLSYWCHLGQDLTQL